MSANERRYITTPLYYVTARPHIGHAYTTILGDVMTRYFRQKGEKVVFLTGTDEHGQKIEQAAEKNGVEPKAFVDEVAEIYRETWRKIGITNDIFYRTTDANHVRSVQHALQFLKDKGDIVFREYEGYYCVGCEGFLTETEMTEDHVCKTHLKPTEKRKEGNYFFLMSRYHEKLVAHYEKNFNAIRPEQYRNEMLSFLKQPLEDLCISRPKDRLKWGIELPFDKNFVTYVWFDALLNYLVATGWPDQKKFDRDLWSQANHLIAKDILKAHAIYWPTMLLALEVPIFKELHVHGYWLMNQHKMSKSIGNVVSPVEIEEKLGRDSLRFYMMREMSFGLDSSYSVELMVQCLNAYLANGIGNLTSRVLSIAVKNFTNGLDVPEARFQVDEKVLLEARKKTFSEFTTEFESLRYHHALKAWSELVTACDLYINAKKPWALAKDPAQRDELEVVLAVCARVIETLGVLIYPVLPNLSADLLKALGAMGPGESVRQVSTALDDRKHYALAPEVPRLFNRIQLPAEEGDEQQPAQKNAKPQKQPAKKSES